MTPPARRVFLGGLEAALAGGSGCVLNAPELVPFTPDRLRLRNASETRRRFDVRITHSERELFSETYNVAPPESDAVPPWNSHIISTPVGTQRATAVSVTVDDGETHHIRYTESDPPESQCLQLTVRIEEGGKYLRFETPCAET